MMSSNSLTDVGGKDDERGASEPSSITPRSTTVIPVRLMGVTLKNWRGLLSIIRGGMWAMARTRGERRFQLSTC